MNNPNSLLGDLRQELPDVRCQMYFKSSLTALSHAMEDLVLAVDDSPLVIANFQHEKFYRQEVHRYQRIAQRTNQVYVLAAPESESGFALVEDSLEIIPLDPNDGLAQEWHLVILAQKYTACLICREQLTPATSMEQARRFEGFWSFDPRVTIHAARLLLGRIASYRPELAPKVEQVWQRYGLTTEVPEQTLLLTSAGIDISIFAQRLVTYLQASQYKLLKAYRVLSTKEGKERLINAITATIRRSLNPQDVLAATVKELGNTFNSCRCLLYRCSPSDQQAKIEYESVASGLPSLTGQMWSLADNPLIQVALAQERAIAIADVTGAPNLHNNPALRTTIERWQIRSWLLVPIHYQGTLLGMLELHHGGSEPYRWLEDDIDLVEAIATQAGVALNQAQAYTDLTELHNQLEALERTRNNLIAIVGHELRTPLSTIRVCLESLESEPEMPTEFRQTMLDTALTDAERMRKLIQDFLTLSKLESGQTSRYPESIQIIEVLDLALSALRSIWSPDTLPEINVKLPSVLPTVLADGEGLVEVLTKLLDNACKFTEPGGKITIQAKINETQPNSVGLITKNRRHNPMLEVIVADTGRGIEPSQLDAIFESFYQEEDSLRRTVGGTGLGLAICRQMIKGMGGKIWAKSEGKNQGSQFHFTIPLESSQTLLSIES
ncbi:histidine kinase [Moorena producens PAL-8-15-08-1]|uniref:histidine kinase n=1 Tax=Moorena producens PAL-8-15-08-1 TaxID=1458985 RepID=A0A1D8TQF6_9CYAN|nr:DICT sensory domain-containing protein [Moorena producens]AOW99846.1 histidine kinase [Moorena producens PAL-8-15-08-1]